MSENVYVVEAKRTPFGSFGGMLADVEAPLLAAAVIKGLLESSSLAPEAVDEVIIGQVLSGGCGQAPARQAMRAAGIPDSTPAMTINKVCGSGLKAVMLASDSIRLGNACCCNCRWHGEYVAGPLYSQKSPHRLPDGSWRTA